MILAEQITVTDAEDVLESMCSTESEGKALIDGVFVPWWANREYVVFYNPDNENDDEEVLKTFAVTTSVRAV